MSNKRKLTENELECLADNLSDVGSDSDLDFDSDDSLGDPNYSNNEEESFDEYSDAELNEEVGQESEIEDDGKEEMNMLQENAFWSESIIQFENFVFTEIDRTLAPVNEAMQVIDIFRLFINKEVIDLMVLETNRYAQEIKHKKRLIRSARISRWHDTDEEEMQTFIGMLILMGLINFPTIECYWKTHPIYYHELFHKLPIKYNRFALLLRCWHFQNNSVPSISRLGKISPLLELIKYNMRGAYSPGHTIVVDETMVPLRGRLKFRQYNPSKSHRYGIKLFKVCTPIGYTWDLKIYDGQGEKIPELDHPGSTVINLVQPLLNAGRLVITDNYYTSIDLAKYLYNRKTHLLGTVRPNRVGLPRHIISQKLQKGQIIATQKDYITFIKWKDQQDVYMLSTCHDDKVEICGKKRNGDDKVKPAALIQYNRGKQGVDISDQLSSYYTCLRKSLIWYKKLAVEIICGSVIVNTLILYNFQHQKEQHLSLLQLRESLICSLLKIDKKSKIPDESQKANKTKKDAHVLEELPRSDDNKIYRKRCHGCYTKLRQQFSSTEA